MLWGYRGLKRLRNTALNSVLRIPILTLQNCYLFISFSITNDNIYLIVLISNSSLTERIFNFQIINILEYND